MILDRTQLILPVYKKKILQKQVYVLLFIQFRNAMQNDAFTLVLFSTRQRFHTKRYKGKEQKPLSIATNLAFSLCHYI